MPLVESHNNSIIAEVRKSPLRRMRATWWLVALLIVAFVSIFKIGVVIGKPATVHAASSNRTATDSIGTPLLAGTPKSADQEEDKDKTATSTWTPTYRPTATLTRTPNTEMSFSGWERWALHDLANVVNWPPNVIHDATGRLVVENVDATRNWERANMRAFEYPAGAAAAFSAEQNDGRLAGFQVTPFRFYSYLAYTAVLVDHNGSIIERQLHWLSQTWILGVDIHRQSVEGGVPDPEGTAEQFLAVAIIRGLPLPMPPPGATPGPTWSPPPLPRPTVTVACDVSFSDVVPGHWAYDYINQLACDQVISGYDDGTFRPDNPTTRAQMAKMLVLSRGWNLVIPRNPSFDDVNQNNVFYSYIETAAAHHVISGYSNHTFHPDSSVTRAQVAKMVVLTRGWAVSSSWVPLRDVPRTHWAWAYVQSALQHSIFTGYDDLTFRPDAWATRAQLAKALTFALR